MNIIKAQNLLKNAPDETLAQYLARPTGDFPEYLVASEMKRRDDLRKKYSAEQEGQAPKTSVIDDLIRQTGAVAPQPPQPPMPAPPMPPEAMGLGAVPPPPGMQLTPAPMMAAAQQAPQQFNDGGIVALAKGGLPSDKDIEDYLSPRAGGSEMGFSASMAPYIPGLDARIRGGIIGSVMSGSPEIAGYQLGYEDDANSALANIIPTPAGAIVGGEYRRQLGNDAEIALRGNYNPYGEQPAMDLRQAPFSVEYTQRFKSGGPVAFKMGGDARYDFDPSSLTAGLPEVQDVPYYFQQQSDLIGPSGTQGYQEALTKQREDLEKRKGNYLSDFLIQSGLGMAASKSINPLQAAAEGALQGFKFYNQAKADDKEVERALLDSEFKFKQAERAEKVGLMGLANQARASAASDRQNAAMLNSRAIELGMRSAEAKDNALHRAEQIDVDKQRLGAEMKRLAVQERRDAEDAKTRALERDIKQFELERLKSGKLSPEKQATVIKYISDLKSDLYSNLAYNDKFNKGLEEIKKKYKDPLEQQRAIQMYMRPYFDQVGISDLEAMLP